MIYRMAPLFFLFVFASCVFYEEGILVDVGLFADEMPSWVINDKDYFISVEQAILSLQGIELLPCTEENNELFLTEYSEHFMKGEVTMRPQRTATRRHALSWVEWFSPAKAFAHGAEGPTKLGAPFIIDFLHYGGKPISMGTMRPLPKAYCGFRVNGIPSDEDNPYLLGYPQMRSYSFMIRGSYRRESQSESTSFAIQVPQMILFESHFEEFSLSSQARYAEIEFHFRCRNWFEGVDFETMSSEEQKEQVLQNLEQSFEVFVN